MALRLLHVKQLTGRLSTGAALALFAATAVGGAWIAYDPALSRPMLLMILGSVGLFLLAAALPPGRVAAGLVLAAGLVAFYFVGQYAHLGYQSEVGLPARLGRITGGWLPALVLFTPHPNAVAGFLGGALLPALALARQSRGVGRLGWGVMSVVIAYALFVTGSRGAWSGLAVAAAIWTGLRFPGRAVKLAGLGAGIGAGLLLGLYLLHRWGASAQNLPLIDSIFNTGGSRLTLYQNSLALFKDYPFTGLGLGQVFAMGYSQYQLLINVPYLYYAHNLFLSVGLGQGILGLAALVWLLVNFYRFVVRVEQAGPTPPPGRLFRAGWLGTTAILVHGFTDSVQFSGDYWTMGMPFALAGLAVAAGRTKPGQVHGDPHRGASAGWRWAVAAVAAGGLVVGSVVFWPVLAGAWQANLGAVYQTWADLSPNLDDATRSAYLERATAHFERALQWNPAQPTANRRLGMVALERREFAQAVRYLERAYAQEPHNQATLKALGYAYLWRGRLAEAQPLFARVEFQSRLVGELRYYHWWWGRQGNRQLAEYAGQMANRLASE